MYVIYESYAFWASCAAVYVMCRGICHVPRQVSIVINSSIRGSKWLQLVIVKQMWFDWRNVMRMNRNSTSSISFIQIAAHKNRVFCEVFFVIKVKLCTIESTHKTHIHTNTLSHNSLTTTHSLRKSNVHRYLVKAWIKYWYCFGIVSEFIRGWIWNRCQHRNK